MSDTTPKCDSWALLLCRRICQVTLGVAVMYAQSGSLVWTTTRIQRVLHEAIPSSAASIPLPEIEGGCLQAPGHDELVSLTLPNSDDGRHITSPTWQRTTPAHASHRTCAALCGLVDDLSP
jgi:hypothetical protein